MKKIGIITIHKSPNYGASLQAFALWKYINDLGMDAEIIDLYRPFFKGYIPSNRFKPISKYRGENFKQRCLRYLRNIKHWAFSQKDNVDRVENNKFQNSELREERFNLFNKQIKYSRPFCSFDELYNYPPQYDTYITGSDQVWNPTLGHCLEPYFLTFVKSGKKISYAPSIGITELTKSEIRKYKKWLNTYDVVSVREKQAQKLLEQIVDKKIYEVSDPTFLLERDYWRSLAVLPQENDYILLFLLDFQQNLVDYAISLAKEAGKTLIVLCQSHPNASDNQYIVVRDAGPKEFLGYISQATMVIGDSFHATVFSIILGTKNFYTYISPWNIRGSRIIDLLEKYHLQEHILNTSLVQTWKELSTITIEDSIVSEVLINEQKQSRDFLEKNL